MSKIFALLFVSIVIFTSSAFAEDIDLTGQYWLKKSAVLNIDLSGIDAADGRIGYAYHVEYKFNKYGGGCELSGQGYYSEEKKSFVSYYPFPGKKEPCILMLVPKETDKGKGVDLAVEGCEMLVSGCFGSSLPPAGFYLKKK